MKIYQVLEQARDLITMPSRWCQCAIARDINGLPAQAESRRAFSFCAEGAIEKAGRSLSLIEIGVCRGYFQSAIGTFNIVKWNDYRDRTHAEVLDAFTRAIELARARR